MTARARRLGLRAGYDPILALAAGVVNRAVDDLHQRRLTGVAASYREVCAVQAALWLASDDAETFCGVLGIDADAMCRALRLER